MLLNHSNSVSETHTTFFLHYHPYALMHPGSIFFCFSSRSLYLSLIFISSLLYFIYFKIFSLLHSISAVFPSHWHFVYSRFNLFATSTLLVVEKARVSGEDHKSLATLSCAWEVGNPGSCERQQAVSVQPYYEAT